MVSQLKVNEIIKQSGSSITIGEAGDTVSGPFTNTPSFLAYVSSNQDVSDSTTTKINMDTTQIDTASAFDTSNYRFTVPTNQGGKYYLKVEANLGNANGSADNLRDHYLYIYKNGSGIAFSDHNPNSGYWSQNTCHVSGIFDLSAGDYIEAFTYINVGSGNGRVVQIDSNRIKSYIFGYRLS